MVFLEGFYSSLLYFNLSLTSSFSTTLSEIWFNLIPKPELSCLIVWFFFFQMGDWISSILSRIKTGILTNFWPMGSYCFSLVGGSGMGGRMLSINPSRRPKPWLNFSWEPSSFMLPVFYVDVFSNFFSSSFYFYLLEPTFPNLRSSKFWPIILSSSSSFFSFWPLTSSMIFFFLSSIYLAF